MSVLVYPRLAALLHARNLTVADLAREIDARFGLTVTPRALQRLTQATPIQRADLEVAGAAAAVLGVELSDIFAVEAIPIPSQVDENLLNPDQARRLQALYRRQERALLTDEEWAELAELVAVHGHRLHEWRMRDLARQRDISIEHAEQETAASLAEALTWWRDLQAEPARLEALITQSRRAEAPAPATGSGG